MLLNHKELYRLPWNYADNIISWLEPTKKCNIYCEGCYSANRPHSHKTLEQIKSDLDVFGKYRITDSMSIAGGEPLCHPEIEKVVSMVAERGIKPVVNTNGFAMTEDKMRAIKEAGLKGLTFHIDSLQHRPEGGWTGKNEEELNELRLRYADMAKKVGGLSVAFNSTVYEETLKNTTTLLKWAQKHIDRVNVMVFICFRAAQPPEKFRYYVNGQEIKMSHLVYGEDKGRHIELKANDVISQLRREYPDYQPCAYLNGTEDPSAMKWLLTLRIADKDNVYGYFGPKFIEFVQVMNHLLFGKYQGYTAPWLMGRAKWIMMFAALFDKGARKALGKWFFAVLKNPLRLFTAVYLQSNMIIQPVDMMEDGRQSMCDGCPDMTVYNGKLVWSCRLEEQFNHGAFVHTVPAERVKEAEEAVAFNSVHDDVTSPDEFREKAKYSSADASSGAAHDKEA
ncbi:MAG: radical SAM protein [Elusimicrobiaceae bacterium]|jgi:pyruvate-formate lyase-activating enzyme